MISSIGRDALNTIDALGKRFWKLGKLPLCDCKLGTGDTLVNSSWFKFCTVVIWPEK